MQEASQLHECITRIWLTVYSIIQVSEFCFRGFIKNLNGPDQTSELSIFFLVYCAVLDYSTLIWKSLVEPSAILLLIVET